MNTVKGKAVSETLLKGGVVEVSERYYRINPETGKLEFSDYDMKQWLKSNAKLSSLASSGMEFYIVVEGEK